ncbi:MAG: NAD(P)-dependent oxidoreductase [Burkholderiales bacterium]
MKRVLITGAAGLVGGVLREHLRNDYRLVLLDRSPMADSREGETAVVGDIRDTDVLRRAMHEVDAVVHLAGEPVETTWDRIRDANIEGCYQVVEAARAARVRRFIFASSNHAIGFHERTERIDEACVTRPDTRYGVSKVFGEAILSYYADKFGLTSVCLRIGTLRRPDAPADRRHLSTWISHRDFAQLVRCSIEADIHFEIAYGVSNNTRSWWQDSAATRLGYHPVDDAESFATSLDAAAMAPLDPFAERYQGGLFCSQEREGT